MCVGCGWKVLARCKKKERWNESIKKYLTVTILVSQSSACINYSDMGETYIFYFIFDCKSLDYPWVPDPDPAVDAAATRRRRSTSRFSASFSLRRLSFSRAVTWSCLSSDVCPAPCSCRCIDPPLDRDIPISDGILPEDMAVEGEGEGELAFDSGNDEPDFSPNPATNSPKMMRCCSFCRIRVSK